MSKRNIFSNLGNLMPSSSVIPNRVSRAPAKSRSLYFTGIVLLLLGFVAGLSIIVLHYDTQCSSGNIFACHSLFDPGNGNHLPYLNGVVVLVFVVGLFLAYWFGPKDGAVISLKVVGIPK